MQNLYHLKQIFQKIIVLLFLMPSLAFAVYDLPNDNSGCPDNCRNIPWAAGSDQWNDGSLPTYTGVECTGLSEGDGTTDNTSAIEACLSKIDPGQAAVLPAGIYYVNGTINIPSNKVLRGAKAQTTPYLPETDNTQTTLKLGPSGKIVFGSGYGSRGAEKSIISGYSKDSQSLTMASGHGFSSNDWISVFEDGDSEIPTDKGGCNWCGENNGSNLIQQFTQITSMDGDNISISRPLYYAYKSNNNPGAKKMTWAAQYAGLENMRLNGDYADHDAFITMSYTLFCWIKGVETYNAGSGAKDSHIVIQWSHGAEIRDSYFHKGRNSSSDRNYGAALFFWNSDHKLENNIFRHHRHSIDFEGGGSGCAILYNYIDDNYTDDLSYLGSARINHGAHPMFNLWEGNIISHLVADSVWGSSSHVVLFRNWLWGDETGEDIPKYPPVCGYVAVELWAKQNYYSVIGNVLGMDSPYNNNWDNATLKPPDCNNSYNYPSPSHPVVYCYDATGANDTVLSHGNYDFKTRGVAYWDGGADHSLKTSMYYDSKPSFMNGYAWPLIGPDVPNFENNNPARDRYEGVENPVPDTDQEPNPPQDLRIIQ